MSSCFRILLFFKIRLRPRLVTLNSRVHFRQVILYSKTENYLGPTNDNSSIILMRDSYEIIIREKLCMLGKQ